MSAGGFQQTPQSLSVSPSSSTPTSNSSNTATPVPSSSTPGPQIDGQGLQDEGSSPVTPSQPYIMIPPQNQTQTGGLPHSIIGSADYPNTTFHFPPYSSSRHQNLFLFAADGTFASLQSHPAFEFKDTDKGDGNSVVSSRPLSNSSLQLGQNASPKPFVTLQVNESKNDKMISGFDGRVDGLSPLSVIAVSAYQDTGHPSPNITNSSLSRTQQILRYHPGGDAMLSAINYSESDTLQSVFDVPASSTFGLDGLLGAGSTPGMRLPDLLDGEVSQEPYIDSAQEMQLSPQTFSSGAEAFGVGDAASLSGMNDTGSVETSDETSKPPESGGSLLSDKLRAKGRPVKATSPSRPGTQPCPTCGKIFSNSSALTKHKLTHSDERKYICQLCAKAFKRQDHLNGHMLTHRNKKPFECDVEGCGKSYCDARSLRRHKENHHSNTATSTSVTMPTVGSHVTVIPGLAHLGFNSVQPSFPASVITSSSGTVFTESSSANRIQYAPPPTNATAQTLHQSSFSQSNVPRTVGNQLISSVVPTAASHLQFLAFQQQPQTQSKTQLQQIPVSVPGRTDGNTVLTPWQPQTINTNALLLAQNFGSPGSQSSVGQSQSGSVGSESLDTSSEVQVKRELDISQQQTQDQKQQDQSLSKSLQEQTCHEQQQTVKIKSEGYIQSPVTSHAPVSHPSESASIQHSQLTTAQALCTLGTRASTGEAVFSQQPTSLSQSLLEAELSCSPETAQVDGGNVSSVPTTPTITEPERPKISSPLLQQLLSPPQPVDILATSHSEGPLQSQAPPQQTYMSSSQSASQSQQVLIPQWTQVPYCMPNTTCTNSRFNSQESKPVECSLCQRKFKNIPALNGHMRLHGGYFKKESELKKGDRKPNGTSQNPPLQTASTNIRALIEEKIIQRRTLGPQQVQASLDPSCCVGRTSYQFQTPEPSTLNNQDVNSTTQFTTHTAQPPVLSPVTQDSSVFTDFPVTSQSCASYDSISNANGSSLPYDWQKEINELKQQFRVPPPPIEKLRRHSDSDHFIPPKRPCTSYTSSALADLLRRKVVAKRTSRTGSDPGEPLLHNGSPHSASTPTTPTTPVTPTHNLPPELTPPVSLASSHPLANVEHLQNEDGFSSMNSEEPILPVLLAEDIPGAQPLTEEGLRDFTEMQLNICKTSSSGIIHSAQGPSILEKNAFLISSINESSVEPGCSQFNVGEMEIIEMARCLTSGTAIPTDSVNKSKMIEDSIDDDVFLSPSSLPTSPMKIKRKHRPEPLYIPPYVNTCGFTSRLRSPRLWDPCNPDNKNCSPPPYTPPPMLSPVRSGSGLFWHIISGSGSLTPKSAPITPSFGLGRKGSTGDVPEEEEFSIAPETDIQPHVNIGSHYQARLPAFNSKQQDSLLCEHKADKVWDPKTIENLSEEDVEVFLELACCASVPGGGRNKEYALHLLQLCKGNLQEAMLKLMDIHPQISAGHPLLTFQYSETDRWSPKEIEAYHQALIKCDKDFFSISKEIQTKTVKQCVQFYYLWKKVCPDEYKRLRLIRRRREQESIYCNLRSKVPSDDEEKDLHNSLPADSDEQSSDVAAHCASLVFPNGRTAAQRVTEILPRSSGTNSISPALAAAFNGSSVPAVTTVYEFPLEPQEEFPCKICGKVFSKVKSRSAHMKSHRQCENDKKNKYEC